MTLRRFELKIRESERISLVGGNSLTVFYANSRRQPTEKFDPVRSWNYRTTINRSGFNNTIRNVLRAKEPRARRPKSTEPGLVCGYFRSQS